ELIVAPSVTERRVWLALAALDRRLGRPGGRLLRRLHTTLFRFMDEVHPVDLDKPEEDYFFFLPAFACFLLVVPFPLHPGVWALARFDDLPAAERSRLVGFYRSCVQRHLYVTGGDRRILSKNPSFTPMVRTLAEAFPDGRLICSLRDPREGVPSLLSSLEDGARMFGWNVRAPDMRDRFVDMLEHFAAHGVETLSSLPRHRHAFVPLPALARDVESTIREVYARFGWTPGPDFVRRLKVETERARAFQSEHLYTLEDFGLRENEVMERFSPHLDRFDLTGSAAS
ncbi:MAG: sulfotransferase, partial [Longimicrobiales bacterium]|nr:sulfotransferase [Longimicrobiales bacterium]